MPYEGSSGTPAALRPEVDLKDIQGLVVRAYGSLSAARIYLLRVEDPSAVRHWIGRMSEAVDPAKRSSAHAPNGPLTNLAFTNAGLDALGLPHTTRVGFSREFREGMVTPHRQRVLGDLTDSPNDPATWLWGGPETPEIHMALLAYAASDADFAPLESKMTEPGLAVVVTLETNALAGQKEHFGFRDGIGQPRFRGLDPGGGVDPGELAPGELLLGHLDGAGERTPAPSVDGDLDQDQHLPVLPGTTRRDLGSNGSYLVIRQLEQDVEGFWSHLGDEASTERTAVELAAKMVGRWPDGRPLTTEHEEPRATADLDAFDYRGDERGLTCPLGAHTRRMNPRDGLKPDEPAASIAIANRHRILRRGRPYGAPAEAAIYPPGIAVSSAASMTGGARNEARGLVFACLNADLERQFEFVQQTWGMNPKFSMRQAEPDPLLGLERAFGSPREYTIPERPLRQCLHEIPQFVRVRGGAYFFLPGIRALRFLASFRVP